ncbi:MAG TPA: hypothetical protein VMD02_02175 [Candidatus Omnitrophota bacterium]|nr:hypothetical protein [Candidatus Omnitrophota bacterium]
MKYLLTPPVAFVILLFVSWLLAFGSAALAFKRKGPVGALSKAYAGGEDVKKHRVQPDYSQFFPFAFFFTILHVVTLMVATVPSGSVGIFLMAVIYILGALFGLFVLFRR